MSFNVTVECVEDWGHYDLNFHIGAIFITFASSLLGIILPISLGWLEPRIQWLNLSRIIYLGKFFGMGVILSTTFVHLFMEATLELQNPCLPTFFTQTFPALPGLIAMISAMVMHLIEWSSLQIHDLHVGHSHSTPQKNQLEYEEIKHDAPQKTHSIGVSVYLVEFAIAVHSVIIGTSLGAASSNFIPLLVAITFHQFFEGIGLGSMVIAVAESSFFIKISILIFACTTPIGVAIGVLLTLAKPSFIISTIFKGVLDSVATGMLFYTSLNLVVISFSDAEFSSQIMKDKVKCFILFYLGSVLMSIFAIWA